MKTADVIVIGLGGMGSASCLALSQRGVDVIGIDQFPPGHSRGSSHGQSRIIRRAYFEHPSYVPLLNRAFELWAAQGTETGRTLYHETGLFYVAEKRGTLLRGLKESARLHKIELETWSEDRLGPFRSTPESEILYEPRAGYLEVENCVVSACELAQRRGVKIIGGEKIQSWSAVPTEVTVVTDQRTYVAEKLIITAGAWSSGLLKSLKLPLTLRRKWMFWFPKGDAYLESLRTPCFLFEMPYGIFYGFPQADAQGVKVAEHSGGLALASPDLQEDQPTAKDCEAILKFVGDALPELQTTGYRASACMYTMTPDEHFIVDTHPDHDNVVFAAGFSGHGFKFCPVIGEALADLALVGRTELPIEFLRRR